MEVSHYNIQREFDIQMNVENRDIGGAADEIDKLISKMKFPVRLFGEVGRSDQFDARFFSSMGVGMILSLSSGLFLMVAQLKSFVDPLLILATVPMGFIGVIWMLFLTNTTMNIQSMMGMIMLIGIVVSNTVILTDFANQKLLEGIRRSWRFTKPESRGFARF